MKTKIFLLILLSLLPLVSNIAQKGGKKITITGTVVDVLNAPVVNAIVMVDGQTTSSVTDSKGVYKIKVERSAVKLGIFSFGSGIIEEAIEGRSAIDFKFSKTGLQQQSDVDIKPGEEGVNTGYNHVKKKNLTTDVHKVDMNDKKYARYTSVYEMIEREVSGVKVGGGNIIIQDSKDFFGSVPALLIVDGVTVSSFDGISPSSVESIEVLKGTAAAIYGSRGYGGAVVVRTKVGNN